MNIFSLMPLVGVLITVVVVGGALFMAFKVLGALSQGEAKRQRLLQGGMPARARVLELQMGGMTVQTGVHRQLQLQLALEVHFPQRPPYVARTTSLISELQIPQVQPGSWLAVRVDPMNPHEMAIEATGVGPPPPGGAPAAAPAPGPQGGYMGGGPQGAYGAASSPGAWGSPPGAQAASGGYGDPPGAFGAGAPAGGFGQPGAPMGIGGYGQVHGGGFGAPMGMPVGGFKLPMGAKIGLGIGLVGAVVGIGAAVMATGWSSGIGGASESCEKAEACCRTLAGTSPAAAACANYTKTTGPIATKVCDETLRSYKSSGICQ